MTADTLLAAKPRRSRGRPKLEETADIDSFLLSVALREFVRHGYGGTSMRQIVKVAGISRTTLALRYPSKEELFRAIMTQQIDLLSAQTALRSEAGPLDLEAGLKSYARRTLDISLKGDLLDVNRLIYSEAHRFPELGAAAAERSAVGVAQIADFIRDCAVKDAVACRDPEGVAEAFILMLRGWYVNVMLTNRDVSEATRDLWVDRAVHTLLSARAEW